MLCINVLLTRLAPPPGECYPRAIEGDSRGGVVGCLRSSVSQSKFLVDLGQKEPTELLGFWRWLLARVWAVYLWLKTTFAVQRPVFGACGSGGRVGWLVTGRLLV